jgi:transposase-like protein
VLDHRRLRRTSLPHRGQARYIPIRWRPLVLGRIKGVAAAKKYPVELKERAVAMVGDLERELGSGRGAIARVASQLGVHPEALRYWVRQDEGAASLG